MPFPILLTLLLSVVPALSTPLVTERTEGTCNRDNVLRALIDKRYIDEAIPFCSKYIKVPASTVTATTSCQTVTITAIVDSIPVTTTITPTVTVTTTTPVSTVYSTYVPPYYKEKRDEPVPTFVSQYPASRISSACSCLTITPSTTTVPCPVKTVATTIKPPAPTITITASPPATTTTTVAGPATTLPALCKPSLFLDYRGGVDREGFGGLVQTSDATKQACCVACFRAKNCTAFQFRPDNPPETRSIAFSGTSGIGLFVTSGQLISISGSGGCVISFLVAGLIVIAVVRTLAEMVSVRPLSGALIDFPHTFVDPALGFAVGIMYWLAQCLSMEHCTVFVVSLCTE